MKRLGFIFLIISILILIISCTQEEVINSEAKTYINKSSASERNYFHEEEYTEYFQEMYMLENLVTHEAYSVDNDVNFTFNFKKKSPHQKLRM